MIRRMLVASCLCLAVVHADAKPKLNVADPKVHPFADPSAGRETYRLAGEKTNEARVYDFYQRQADYYLALPREKWPEILPAHPGLDAGLHGHWGKHNQNRHEDGRWNDIEIGEVLTQVFRAKDLVVLKGISVKLGEKRELSACFDPQTLQYRALWEGGFVTFHPFRWGTSRNATLEGTPWYIRKEARMPEGGMYQGFYRQGKHITFVYRIGKTTIADEPWADETGFYRRLTIGRPLGAKILPEVRLPVLPADSALKAQVVSYQNIAGAKIEKGELVVEGLAIAGVVMIHIGKGGEPRSALTWVSEGKPLAPRWTETLKGSAELGAERLDSAYVVDTIEVPYDNPYKQVMQLSGIAFLKNADALVSTLAGDIWRVSGLDADLKNVTWRRFATGFNQPMGIHIDDSGIYVLDRGQIYRLDDRNKDGEADSYENYASDFGGYDRSHTHTFGLHRTSDGSFHFTQRESILRTGPDRKTVEQGWGVRNCMGIGGSAETFWVAPQEGTWTPGSEIIEVNQGEFYGLPKKDGTGGTIAAPLCFIPRGVDNSTGGMVEITSDHWGPFKGNHVGLSYGSGTYYLILRDDTGARPQGAVVPLEGEFTSGVLRGAFHPKDGQLYAVGLDGWGDYSIQDGCLNRVRFTGKPVYKPRGFRVYSNGIRIDFTTRLDRKTVEDVKNIFAQAWNYEYAKRYGSPEFSVRDPKSLGHDPVEVRSVRLLDSGDAIFVEMPALEPVMQLHLRMHFKAADGRAFKTDLFASPMYPGDHFALDGLAPPTLGKTTAIALRVSDGGGPKGKTFTKSGEKIEGARELLVEAANGLQFVPRTLAAKPGEALVLRFRNGDVMPHNWVLVEAGALKLVGETSFKMLNDPEAGKKHYVPDLPQVLQVVPVINAESEHLLYFRAPEKAGAYPFLCTFPGHWQVMQGVLEVNR